MTIFQQRQQKRFQNSIQFIDQHEGEFASGSKALSLREELKDVLGNFGSAGQEKKIAGPRSYNSAKLAALNALRADLVAISQSAQVIADSNPKFKNTFNLPDRRRKNELADAARQFLKDAAPVKNEFLGLEMREDFLDQLKERLAAYEATQTATGVRVAPRQASNDALGSLVAQGAKAVEVLDIVLKNKFNGNDEVLTEWQEASKLEFTPRRKRGERAAEKAAKK